MNITKAVEELKQELSGEEPWDATLADIARSFDLAPEVLQRRFEKAFGPIADFAEREFSKQKSMMRDAGEAEVRKLEPGHPDRRFVSSVKCPFCQAPVDEPCQTAAGEIIRGPYLFHQDRVNLARQARGYPHSGGRADTLSQRVKELWASGQSPAEIARVLGIGTSTVYRLRNRELKS